MMQVFTQLICIILKAPSLTTGTVLRTRQHAPCSADARRGMRRTSSPPLSGGGLAPHAHRWAAVRFPLSCMLTSSTWKPAYALGVELPVFGGSVCARAKRREKKTKQLLSAFGNIYPPFIVARLLRNKTPERSAPRPPTYNASARIITLLMTVYPFKIR